jgi:hypothetical protein
MEEQQLLAAIEQGFVGFRKEFRKELTHGFTQMQTELREELTQMRTELRDEFTNGFKQVRTELRDEFTTGFKQVRTELRGEFTNGFKQVRTELRDELTGTIDAFRKEFTVRSEQTDRRMISLDKSVSELGPLMERLLERIEIINEVCDHNENVVAIHRSKSDSLDLRVMHLEARVSRIETRKK